MREGFSSLVALSSNLNKITKVTLFKTFNFVTTYYKYEVYNIEMKIVFINLTVYVL